MELLKVVKICAYLFLICLLKLVVFRFFSTFVLTFITIHVEWNNLVHYANNPVLSNDHIINFRVIMVIRKSWENVNRLVQYLCFIDFSLTIYFVFYLIICLVFVTVFPRTDESATSRVKAKSFLIQDTILFPGMRRSCVIRLVWDAFCCHCCHLMVLFAPFQVSDLRNSLNIVNSAAEEVNWIFFFTYISFFT